MRLASVVAETKSYPLFVLPERARNRSSLLNLSFIVRVCATALFVFLSYRVKWEFLRYSTSELNLRLDSLIGIFLERVSNDTLLWHGVLYRYQNACIFVDVWCGSIPLLWKLNGSNAENIRCLSLFSLSLFGFNVVRLTLSDCLYSVGLPWLWSHGILVGITYFLVWTWIWRRKAWVTPLEPFGNINSPSGQCS
jgi:hypothetical protein